MIPNSVHKASIEIFLVVEGGSQAKYATQKEKAKVESSFLLPFFSRSFLDKCNLGGEVW